VPTPHRDGFAIQMERSRRSAGVAEGLVERSHVNSLSKTRGPVSSDHEAFTERSRTGTYSGESMSVGGLLWPGADRSARGRGTPMTDTTDYLVVGSGASAMAFVDTILQETDASVTMIDRRAVPGGHWNDAYPFVRLHQPAGFYGVASKPLGRDRIETDGLNAGMFELSSGVEITAYYHDLMNEVFLPSGRVTYLPLTEYVGDGTVVSTLSGARRDIEHETLVDATYLTTSIPSTHERKFEVADGVTCIPPNQLPRLAAGRPHITVLGGGKTGVDALTWLLSNGYPAESVSWVVPRDAWFLNRRNYQPAMDFFDFVFGGMATHYEVMAEAPTVDELCLEFERTGRLVRVDPSVWPTMFHAAILSEQELETLRRIPDVIRGQRVRRIETDAIVLDTTTVEAAADTLYVDCTASAVADNVNDRTPVFEPGRINLQMIRQFQPCFSSALIAFIEANVDDEAERRSMTRPTPMTDTFDDYLRGFIDNTMNQAVWMQDESVARWIGSTRLDGFSRIAQQVSPGDTEKMAVFGRIDAATPRALENLQRLVVAST